MFPAKPFDSVDEARDWVLGFVGWYNEAHRHSGIQLVTPGQRHRAEDKAILGHRKTVNKRAKARHPERWSGNIRDLEPVKEVWLNPDRNEELSAKNSVSAG